MKTNYIVITPVYNEDEYIERTIKSVIKQTILPQLWLIVDDGSTDGTNDIIKKYEDKYDFIKSLRLDREETDTYYGHRTHVVLTGYKHIENMQYDFLGILDADITLEPTYYESILGEFDKDSELGLASGVYVDVVNGQLKEPVRDPEGISTPGAIQVFRRECYEAIGGFQILRYGGDDTLSEIMTRMKGFKTRHFVQYQVLHHRPVGEGKGTHVLTAKYRAGLSEYVLGSHPLFILAKSLRRLLLEKPVILASTVRMIGFFSGYVVIRKREVAEEIIKYVRKEQIQRLFKFASGKHKLNT